MEHIRLPKVEKVRLLDRVFTKRSRSGTLYLTATHTIFVESEGGMRNETWVLHSLVCSVEKQATTPSGSPLLIHCKNFQVLHFVIPQERECHDVHVSLLRLSQPEHYDELYCFSYKPNVDAKERRHEWDFLDLKAEYTRMGIPNSLWKLSLVNQHYKVSDTYPAELFVPESTTPSVITGSSKFRSRGRFPTLSYYYKENRAAICRSSQPLSGFSARCVEDEQMLEAILRSNPHSDFMYVVDTRPKLNAMANRAAGKGYENEDNYSHIKFQFAAIENIHVMRNSQHKMLEGTMIPNSQRGFNAGNVLLAVHSSPLLKCFHHFIIYGKMYDIWHHLSNSSYFHMTESSAQPRCLSDALSQIALHCAAIRPQLSPQENFWVLCRGDPRKTLNPSGFYF